MKILALEHSTESFAFYIKENEITNKINEVILGIKDNQEEKSDIAEIESDNQFNQEIREIFSLDENEDNEDNEDNLENEEEDYKNKLLEKLKIFESMEKKNKKEVDAKVKILEKNRGDAEVTIARKESELKNLDLKIEEFKKKNNLGDR
mgnify:CR=1 FL=1